MKNKLPVGITMGDPGGIGPEIILKSLRSQKLSGPVIIYGHWPAFQAIASSKNKPLLGKIQLLNANEKTLSKKGVVFYSIDVMAKKYVKSGKLRYVQGKLSKTNGALALAAIEQASKDAKKGKIRALVTAPLNKKAVRLIQPKFIGHTEYLAQASKTSKFAMMFVGGKFSLTLVTIHVPLKKVAGLINQNVIYEKILLTHEWFKKFRKIAKPRIAVSALNPHGRETGEEEDLHILPAVHKAKKKGVKVEGPIPADLLFYKAYEGCYDAVISMYHDQGLAPFKMVSFHDGVNTTLGLPYIRTSPDHGTAFDIVGKGIADERSFKTAFRMAEQWT